LVEVTNLNFSEQDLQLQCYPYNKAILIRANIVGWEINRVLIDSGSLVDIIFVNAFNQMKLSRTQLQPSDSPLIGFRERRLIYWGKYPSQFQLEVKKMQEQNT